MSFVLDANAKIIWDYLKGRKFSDCGVAGLMGNLYAESGLNPMNLQNMDEKKLGFTDQTYTAAVDSGAYSRFSQDSAGYGLAQWTYRTRKAALLAYAQSTYRSIGDLEMQLEFLVKELAESFQPVLLTLQTAVTVRAASDCVLERFERPANVTEKTKTRREGLGLGFYEWFVKQQTNSIWGGTSMTEQELRAKMVAIVTNWLGACQGDTIHKSIIDTYNSHRPLARGYQVRYTDPWCAVTVSAAAIKAGLTDILPTECSCSRMIALHQSLGQWVENDAYVPQAGDLIMYDWKDTGAGDCTGAPKHVGMVVSVSGSTIKIIEGNKSKAVGYRNMKVNSKYIRGYCVPNYRSKVTAPDALALNSNEAVYIVVQGDTLSKIAHKQGTTVSVLASLNGITDINRIHVGQALYLTEAAAAIGKLTQRGIISAPDYWQNVVASGSVNYLDQLLVKVAATLT